MKSTFLSLCAVFVVAIVGQQASAQIVSLSSSICGTKSGLQSNAYQFRYQGRVLVLASADYTLNDVTACHAASGNSLRLIKSDWAAGVALFENTQNVTAPDVQWGTPKLGKKVMFGPGKGSGLIQSNKSDRHEFGLQKDVLEIARLCLPPGAAGLPLFDYDNGDQVVGFISSQFIDVIPGKIARITRFRDFVWGGIDCFDGPFIALSAVNVKAWTDQALAEVPGSAANTPFTWDVPAQLSNLKKINWGPFALTENCPAKSSGGVADNYPIGGGDPFGIGGVNSASLPCKFAVSLNGGSNLVTGPYAAFAQGMTELLKQNKNVELYLGYTRVNGVLINRGFISIGDFFKTLLVGDKSFVLMVDGKKDDAALTRLQAQARQFRLSIQRYPFDSADYSFRNRGYLIALMLEGPQAGQVSRQDLLGLKELSPWLEYDAMIDGLVSEIDGVRP